MAKAPVAHIQRQAHQEPAREKGSDTFPRSWRINLAAFPLSRHGRHAPFGASPRARSAAALASSTRLRVQRLHQTARSVIEHRL